MGQSALKALCGKNLGYFPDNHDSPTNSDDEGDEQDSDADQYMPKGHREAKNSGSMFGKLKKRRDDRVSAGVRGWAPYMTSIEVGGIRQPGIRANKAKISSAMLERLKAVGSVHTLEITYCQLNEFPPINHIDDLMVLQLSHNCLRHLFAQDSETALKVFKLEKFICDWNKVDTISPGLFAGGLASNLQAINLAHNELAFLPRDFGSGASRLLYLDVSYNKLQHLPEALFSNCKRLQLLHAARNELRDVPSDIGVLKDLRKIFLSHNKLREIPDSIGDCLRLEKVRLIANEIRFLPDTFIFLWKEYKKGGRLEELLVDGNPLVQPSITAFEMGGPDGLDRAMKLFGEWLEDKKRMEREAAERARLEGSEPQAALTAGAGPMAALGDVDEQPGDDLADANRGPSFLSQPSSEQLPENNNELEDVGAAGLPHQRYYFGHVTRASAEIAEIRNAESRLLLHKKTVYLDGQRKIAFDMERKANQIGTGIPERMRMFLNPDFHASQFTEVVPVTDLDLYFNLLVFSTRPMFSTCQALFEKFRGNPQTSAGQTSAGAASERTLSKNDWQNLCNRVPVKLPPQVKEEIWNMLAWPQGVKIKFVDFVAGWHIHDIEIQDPFIRRVADVQRLDYYDMDVDEMKERLKAKAAKEASMPLAFAGAPGQEARGKVLPAVHLAPMEGERRIEAPGAGADAGGATAVVAASTAGGTRKLPQISMTNAQYVENETGNIEDAQDADDAMDSDVLSRDEDSVLSAFDAVARLQEDLEATEELEKQRRLQDAAKNDYEDSPHPHLTSQQSALLDRQDGGGTTPTRGKIMGGLTLAKRSEPKAKAKAGRRRKKKDGPTGGRTKDPRFKTDVFEVRQALRESHRNMPYEDFKKLVNFMVRGVTRISDFANQITYWHIDDPSFRYATGIQSMHSYAEKLLIAMGFVCVADTYWVWPEKHLSRGHDWGHLVVPPECPGLSSHRLGDMVTLLKACQQGIAQEGKSFTGHFH